ncbi:hypothetical protein BGZ76_003127 [Entomortierella beljakovae]|nr:hypothetical protein BGZ76_003127 [Entomortierella beljakovae]
MTTEITYFRQLLNLSNALGRVPQDYYLSRSVYIDSRYLLNLVTTQILPTVVDPTRPNNGIPIIVSLIYDDSVYIEAPCKITKNILNGLNNAPFQKRDAEAPPTANATLTTGYTRLSPKMTMGYGDLRCAFYNQ